MSRSRVVRADELEPGVHHDGASKLSADELAELLALRRVRTSAETFHQFVARVAPRFARVPRHLQPIYDLVERTRTERVFATISIPPRHGKTTTLALAVAWRILYDPGCQHFYTTYAGHMSSKFGLAVMQIAERLRMPLNARRRAVTDWGTVFGGGLLSTSKGGQITGGGANGGLVIADDILKGYKEARSRDARDAAWDYLTVDVMSRLEGGSSLFAINTRWDEDDVIGRLLADNLRMPFVHINMAAICDEHGRPIDELEYPEIASPLWLDVDDEHPGDWNAAMSWYADMRARGEHWWWALYQGVPRSEKAKIFGDPHRYMLPSSRDHEDDVQPFNWDRKRGAIILDPAATKKTSSDHSAVSVMAMEDYGKNAVGYIVDANEEKLTVPEASRMAYEWKERYNLPLVVEAVAGFKAVPQTLEEIEPGLDVSEALVFGDKFTRAQPAAAAWNRGRLLVPTLVDITGKPLRNAKWINGLIKKAKRFTGQDGGDDDIIDTIAHGWNYLNGVVNNEEKWTGMVHVLAGIAARYR